MLNKKVFVIYKREVHEGLITGHYISKQTGYEKFEVATDTITIQADKCMLFNTEEEAVKDLPKHIQFLDDMLFMIKNHQILEDEKRKEMIGEPMIADLSIFQSKEGE